MIRRRRELTPDDVLPHYRGFGKAGRFDSHQIRTPMIYRPTDELDARPAPTRPTMSRRRKLAILAGALAVVALGFLFAQHAAEQSTRDEIGSIQQSNDELAECVHLSKLQAIRDGKCGQ